MAQSKGNGVKADDIELLSNGEILGDFANGGSVVEVTDLITNRKFRANWAQDGNNHAHLWFMGTKEEMEKNSDWLGGWLKDARPILVTAKDDNGKTRNIAYGWVAYPHYDNWNEKPFHVDGEMCIFNGSNVQGYGRDYGNEAAYGALNGNYHIFPLRPPK